MADTGPPTGLQHKVGGLPQWAWIGLATAAAVVGMVWWKSRSTAASTTSTTPTTTADTSGQATGLSTEQYESLLALLRDIQGNQSTPVNTTPTPTPTPTPTAPTDVYSSVMKGWGVNQWIRDLQSGYGEGGGNPNITWDQLVAMNPSILANVYNLDGPTSKNSERNVFRDAARYRIK
jgi:hypothetical protein